jgi:hypothetical protein
LDFKVTMQEEDAGIQTASRNTVNSAGSS